MKANHILLKYNVRPTPARTAILDVITAHKKPIDAQILGSKLRARHNKTTIYRTLDLLVDKKIVRKLELGDRKFHYELQGEHHHHLICGACERIQDAGDLCSLLNLKELSQKFNFAINDHKFELYGTCNRCQ